MPDVRTAAQDEIQTAIRRIVEAAARVPRGTQAPVMAVSSALDEVQHSVDAARALGVAGARIDEALGMWRGSVATESVLATVAEKPVIHLREQLGKEDSRARRARSVFQPSHRAPAIR